MARRSREASSPTTPRMPPRSAVAPQPRSFRSWDLAVARLWSTGTTSLWVAAESALRRRAVLASPAASSQACDLDRKRTGADSSARKGEVRQSGADGNPKLGRTKPFNRVDQRRFRDRLGFLQSIDGEHKRRPRRPKGQGLSPDGGGVGGWGALHPALDLQRGGSH